MKLRHDPVDPISTFFMVRVNNAVGCTVHNNTNQNPITTIYSYTNFHDAKLDKLV